MRGANVIVIGRDFDEVATTISNGRSWTVIRCASLEEFGQKIEQLPAGSVERLDIFDHGGEGFIKVGDQVLFQSDSDPVSALRNAAIATQMMSKLTSAAQVRLLGCDTGSSAFGKAFGRHLVLKLAALLNPPTDVGSNRIVFATIDAVRPGDFTPEGLDRQKELALLYSSYTAIDYDCPERNERFINITRFRATHG